MDVILDILHAFSM